MGTGGSFPGGKSGRGVKLTTHLHLVPRSRMRGAIYSSTHQYIFMAWCLVKHRKTLPLYIDIDSKSIIEIGERNPVFEIAVNFK
jgi:hypothetical protein